MDTQAGIQTEKQWMFFQWSMPERYKQTWQRLAKELFEKESLNREEIETILHDIEFNSIKRDEDGNLIFN